METIVVTLTSDPDGRTCLYSHPYDEVFKDAMKRAIPWDGREWVPGRRRWLIDPAYDKVLLDFLHTWGCQVQDGRPQALAPVPEQALTPAPEMPVYLREAFDALDLQYHAPLCAAEAVFRAYAKYYHPDKGGDPERFHRINDAIKIIRAALEPPTQADEDDDLPF